MCLLVRGVLVTQSTLVDPYLPKSKSKCTRRT